MKQRYGLFKVVFNVLVVGLLLGCSFVSSLVSKPTYEPLPPAPTWMGGEITPVSVPTALPSPTAVGKSTLISSTVTFPTAVGMGSAVGTETSVKPPPIQVGTGASGT